MTLISDTIKTIDEKIEFHKESIKKLKEAEEIQEIINCDFQTIIDVLELLCPNHNRTSCNDDNASNYGSCDRCTILKIQAEKMWDDNYIVKISIDKIRSE